jgi:GT2 family glycosyltransferase
MSESITPTVIIPVLNNPTGLARCIEAIRRSSTKFELIVVDNGSTDETLSVARRYTECVLECPGMTIGAMRNEGAKVAKGAILVFTDSDQEPSHDWLKLGMDAIASDPRIGLAGARVHAPPQSRWVARTWDLQRRMSDRAGDIGWLEAGNLFARREAFGAVGGFRSDLIASEDVDLSFRVRRAGYRVVCDPRIVNYHHGDPKTLVEFFQKEQWRGSSGWRAWITQGSPISELPGLLWPFWVVFSFPFSILVLIQTLDGRSATSIAVLITLSCILWASPSLIVLWRILSHDFLKVRDIFKLVLLHYIYGFARFRSLFGSGNDGK